MPVYKYISWWHRFSCGHNQYKIHGYQVARNLEASKLGNVETTHNREIPKPEAPRQRGPNIAQETFEQDTPFVNI